jgi:predicted esterase
MKTLGLRATYAVPEGPPATGGLGRITQGEHLAWVLAPHTPAEGEALPLVVVLHGAGRQDEMIARGLEAEPDRRRAVFVVPRSRGMTWDLIEGGDGHDLAFLGLTLDSVYRRFPIDPARQAIAGFSDGASYALGVGLSNPRVFAAVMAWAAGFLVIDAERLQPDDPKPRVFLEYGTRDQLFPFDRVALPMRDLLLQLGYPLDFRTDEGGIHWPRPGFLPDALDWFLGLDTRPASS